MRLLNWWYRVAGGTSRRLEDTWPLWVIGFLGGAMVLGGLIVLMRGW